LFLAVAGRIDGGILIEQAAREIGVEPGAHVLSVGKAAFPMLRGLRRAWTAEGGPDREPSGFSSGLMVAPEPLFPGAASLVARPIADRLDAVLPARVGAIPGDHPEPTTRSAAAARAAHNFVARLTPEDHLVVLLSGGTSSLLAAPAGDLTLEDKRVTAGALARAGASIAELNTVRKHLSRVKGGRLGLATGARVTVLALADVIGNDPALVAATVGSGPFSPDPTTFGEALAIVERLAPASPPRVLSRLALGASRQIDETPKPGDPRLAAVAYHVVAGPARVHEEARRAGTAAGVRVGVLCRDTDLRVEALAAAYVERARHEVVARGAARVLIGNGEPTLELPSAPGRGGRCTHLALLVARGIAGLVGVTFLAAGTDDRDGSSGAVGAVVDGRTWPRAQELGLDTEGALLRYDSAAVLAPLGALVQGPAASNLLDLHLMEIDGP